MTLILASGSPRRKELLTRAGIALHCMPPSCDETWRPPEDATTYAARVALDKAKAVAQDPQAQKVPGASLVLAADTTVWIPGQPAPLGKPKDRQAAKAGLNQLFDASTHRVSTAFCLIDLSTQQCVAQECVTTLVGMRRPSPAELEHYLDTQEWNDKAGGYGIQGAAAGFVTELQGSYTNVVGLPLAKVLETLGQIEQGRNPRNA